MRITNMTIVLAALLLSSMAGAQVISVVINDRTSPETTLTVSQLSGNPPLTIVFTALCRDDIEIASCVLSFGDGSNQILQRIQLPQTITHTYRAAGNFMATLTASDTSGNSDQTPALVTINAISPAPANIDPQTSLQAIPVSGESPLEVTFIVICRDSDGAVTSCELDFGDGNRRTLTNTTAPQTALHTYENRFDRTVFRVASVQARDDRGGVDQTPASIIVQVQPGLERTPETFINAFPRRGKTPLEVTFDVVCADADGRISTCEIDFGDGETERLLNIEVAQQIRHIYVNPGVNELRRTAKIRASDDEGNSDPTPAEITIITETDVGNAPETSLRATPSAGPAPLLVNFIARCSDLQRRLTECRLTFGDGAVQNLPPTESSQTVSHVYQRDGRYIALLDAKDAEGLTDLDPASATIVIGAGSTISAGSAEAGAGRKRTVEFDVDIANFKDEETFTAQKRLFNGLLFGSNEIRLSIPKSFVREIVIDVQRSNLLGDLVVTIGDEEIYRGRPEAASSASTASFAAAQSSRKVTIPVNREMDGVLKVRATSSGFTFWAPAVYEVKVDVTADVEKITEGEFDFVLDNELDGFRSAKLFVLPRNTEVTLNNRKLTSDTIPKEYFRRSNTIRFRPLADSSVQARINLEVTYI